MADRAEKTSADRRTVPTAAQVSVAPAGRTAQPTAVAEGEAISVEGAAAQSRTTRHQEDSVAGAEIILGKLGLTGRYHALACGDEVADGKPAPDIFLLAAARLNVAPEACLALEDSVAGCMAAAAAGMRVVVVPTELTHGETFLCAHRRYPSLVEVAADLEELLAA